MQTAIFAEHPKMFFSTGDIPGLKEQAQTTHAVIWQPILNTANSLLSKPIPTYPGSGAETEYTDIGLKSFLPLAFAYVITGDDRYLNHTRDYLLESAKWQDWGKVRDLEFHYMLLGYALAYDWIYDRLSDEERTTIRNALIKHTEESYEAATNVYQVSEWNNWWRRSYLQNHWSCNIGALGVACLVLEGEDARVTTWLNHAIDEYKRDSYFLSGINDGTWHEGYPYQDFKLVMSLPFYHNLKRLKGTDIIPSQYLQNYAYWRTYNYLPGTGRPAFPYSDMNPDWGWNYVSPQVVLRFIAGQYNNGYAEWIAQHILSTITRSSYRVQYYIFEFFYYNSSVIPTAPYDLPLDRTFNDAGIVVWRTGWGSDDIVFGLKSGYYGGKFVAERYINSEYPFENRYYYYIDNVQYVNPSGSMGHTGHDHADANTFYLSKGGYDLSSEKPHRTSAIGTSYHNTILVDEKEQYKPKRYNEIYEDTDARIEAVYETPDFNYLSADAANMYRERNSDINGSPGDRMINEFKRHVLFVKPGYFVMVDNIRSEVTHRYDLISHVAEGGSITVEGDWIKGRENDTGYNVLGIKVLAPAGFDYTTGISTNSEESYKKPYIRVRPSANVANTQFINVLYPTTSQEWNSKPDISLLGKTDDGAVVRVCSDGVDDHIFKYGTADEITIYEYKLKGDVASVLKDGSGNLKKIFLGNGSLLSDTDGNRVLIQSLDTNKTFEAVYSETSLALYGENLQSLKIYAPGVSSSQVTVNGEEASVTISGNYIISSDTLISSIDDLNENNFLSMSFKLYQNYPNPFNPCTEIKYEISKTSNVTLKIYNILGQNIQTLVDEKQSAGLYNIKWVPENITSGVYIYQLRTGDFAETKKLIFLK